MAKEINDSAYWREFERNELTHSAAHYLMAIDSLHEEFGYVRVTDVADKLDVSRGAASMAITHLKKRGWVKEDPRRMLFLADEGNEIVNRVEHNFRILTKFFGNLLGVSKDTAFADACKMEHLMSSETGQRILGLMHFMEGDTERMEAFRDFVTSGSQRCTDIESCPICEDVCLADAALPAREEKNASKI